ncbi:MAG: 30S ribosomal protein S4 [Thermoplasmata archaeon]
MGDPKFSRRKYDTPSHPWQASRIQEENEILRKYGLKNKREVWKAQSYLRGLRRQARELQARLRTKDPQAEKEFRNLIKRAADLGLLPPTASLDDVLALNVDAILGRRLQTLVYQKGLAATLRQARQMIVHGHVAVGGRKVRVPGYLVRSAEAESISYSDSSPFADELHPMRPKPKELLPVEVATAKDAGAAGAKGMPTLSPEKEKLKEKVEKLAAKGEQIERGG